MLYEAFTSGPWDVPKDLLKRSFLEAHDYQATVVKVAAATVAFFCIFAFIRLFIVPRYYYCMILYILNITPYSV